MAVADDLAERVDRPPFGPAYLSSVIALVSAVVLAVGVSAVCGLLGWGGELVAQTAGVASGAVPLIIDGVRQRRAQRSRPSPRGMTRGLLYRPKLFIASAFGFAVLLIDSAAGLVVFRLTRWTIQLADGDPARLVLVYTVLGSVITLPAVFVGTYLLAVAAAHRLGDRTGRWLLLGMGIYAVVRAATVLVSGPAPELGVPKLVIIGGLILTVPLLSGIALLGARRAHKTQAAYYAKVFFRRLKPADQEAMVTLLDETVAVRKT